KTLSILVKFEEQRGAATELRATIEIRTEGLSGLYLLHTYLTSETLVIEGIYNVFIYANGLTSKEVAVLWDQIQLTDLEEDVLGALRILVPTVERLGFREGYNRDERIPIVRVSGSDSPERLRSMGEGMNRILGIALALVNAKDGILLV